MVLSKNKVLPLNTSSILSKYLPDETIQINKLHTLAMIILYLTPEMYEDSDHDAIERLLLEHWENEVKVVVLLENVAEWIKA
jgi:hypothetical protein